MVKGRIRFAVLEALLLAAYIGSLACARALLDSGLLSFHPDFIRVQGVATFLWALLALALSAFELRRQHREEPLPIYTPEERRKRLVRLAASIMAFLAIVYGIDYSLYCLGVFFGDVEDLNRLAVNCVVSGFVVFALNAFWMRDG